VSTNINNTEINYQILPDSKLVFELDQDVVQPNIKGAVNGSIKIDGIEVHYTPKKGFSGIERLSCTYTKRRKRISRNITIKVGYAFKAKSHILSLLGDELIGSDNLAIFELVKNAYDADAEEVKIILNDLNTPKQSIMIEDDGNGMTLETLQNVWLEIGTDFKRGLKRKPSQKYKRISLGEKGVGRLAVHKLGKRIIVETQPKGGTTSYQIILNWADLISDSEYIQDTFLQIETIKKSLFPKKKHGTRLIISELKKESWTKKDLRDLARKTNSIKSPFRSIDKFNVIITANDHHKNWFEDVKDPKKILAESLYFFKFDIDEKGKIEWSYDFRPPKSFGLKTNHKSSKKAEDKFLKIDKNDEVFEKNQKTLKKNDLVGIGPISGQFYVYNLISQVLNALSQTTAVKEFVKDNYGVKLFRNGIRVYNYGEASDDWLGLDLGRVQKLGEKFSRNTVVGAIEIEMKDSHGYLVEKTNREGFDENYYFKKFKAICIEVFGLFQDMAIPDRELIKAYLEGIKPVAKVGLSETLLELKQKLKEKKIEVELAPLIKRVEKDYNNMRDVMLNSGMTGLNLGLVFHEVDREMRFINADLDSNKNINTIKERVKNLIQLLENFSPILRQNKNIIIKASELVEKAKNINNPRFSYHKVVFSSPLISHENKDFSIKGPANLLLSAVSNIIDNAIYWVSLKRETENEKFKSAIYIGSDIKSFSGPAIIIADNGNGFNLEPDELVQPFRTTRPGGMGLGLYFVNVVMEMIGGKLLFPDREDLDIPKPYTGATIALVFPK
jgi:Histidine kinase-, DNA gyrase B-, and HSP90-like ATPase